MSNKFFPSYQTGLIDLRKEISDLLYGNNQEPPKGQFLIFRKMRRKEGIYYPVREDDLIKAPDVNNTFDNNNTVYISDWSKGERFLFDDYLITGYRWQNFYQVIQGHKHEQFIQTTPYKDMFFLEWMHNPSTFDKLLEPVINYSNGEIVTPIKILRKYEINMAEPYRSDFGRVEFWRCAVVAEPDQGFNRPFSNEKAP